MTRKTDNKKKNDLSVIKEGTVKNNVSLFEGEKNVPQQNGLSVIKEGTVKKRINALEGRAQNDNLTPVNQATSTSERLQLRGNEVSNERPNRPHSPVENVSENKQQGQCVTEPTPNQCSDPSSSLLDQSYQKHQTKPAHETKRSIKHVGDSQKKHLATQSTSFYKFVNQRYASIRSKNQSQGVSVESVATQASTQMTR